MRFLIGFTLFLTLSISSWGFAGDLWVNGYYTRFTDGKKASGGGPGAVVKPTPEKWREPIPKRPYRIGVLFPHLEDAYWETAHYGIVSHANKLGLEITLQTAGAYAHFGDQRSQLMALAHEKKVDGILIATVDYTKMDPFVNAVVAGGTPVVALINDIHTAKISAKTMVSFFQVGYETIRYALRISAGRDLRLALLPGPKDSGWADDTVRGVLAAMSDLKKPGQALHLIDPLFGDTRQDVQQMRLDGLSRKANQGLDFIIANAVGAVKAVAYLEKNRRLHPMARIISTYMTAPVYAEIQKGRILSALSDQTLSQCRIALDMVVKILNGESAGKDFPFCASPIIPLITMENIHAYPYERLFGPRVGTAP
jgi:periplasmic protein TorT